MPSSQHEGSRAPKLRGQRLPIAGVVVLVIVCASGATYIFRNSLLESGSSTLTADSGIGAEHKPPPLSEPIHLAAPLRPPGQEPASGSETSAPAASSGQNKSHVPGADELVDFRNMLRQQKQAATAGAADASLNATPPRIAEPAPPVQPFTEPQAKPVVEIPATVGVP